MARGGRAQPPSPLIRKNAIFLRAPLKSRNRNIESFLQKRYFYFLILSEEIDNFYNTLPGLPW